MRHTRILRLVAALAAVMVLASCARIPLSGPVTEGQEVAGQQEQDERFLPDPPRPGAAPDEIVRGFLEAGTGTQVNYETARSYLTDEESMAWDPTARVIVHTGTATYTQTSPGTVRVDVEAVAEVGPDGAYEAFPSPRAQSLEFQVVNVEGEWRIAAAENGLVLSSERFDLVFDPFTLYFFDSTYRYLVPDVRWYPNYTTAPSRIVQGILNGPVEWLAEGSVSSAFPADTVLRGPVRIEGDTALADFSPSISTASTDRFSLMLLQLRESLSGVANIADVRMSVNGASLDVDLPPDGAVHPHATVNATPLVYRDGELGYLSGESITPPTGTERMLAMLPNLKPTRGTVAVDQGLGAFITPSGVMAVPFATGQPVQLDARSDLGAPSIDPFGFVWSVSGRSDRVHVSDVGQGVHETLGFQGYGRDGILSLQVSRDGARVVALVRDGTTVSFVIASVERADGTGEPIAIGTPISVPLAPGAPIELTWVDETSVAILVSDGAGSTAVRIVRVGGETTEYGAVENGVQIAGSNTLAGLRVLDRAGGLHVPRNNRWQVTAGKIGFLVTQA